MIGGANAKLWVPGVPRLLVGARQICSSMVSFDWRRGGKDLDKQLGKLGTELATSLEDELLRDKHSLTIPKENPQW